MARETREFWVSDEPDEAVRKAKITLRKLGTLKHITPGMSINGAVAFGVQQVDLRILWRAEELETKMDQALGMSQSAAPRKVVGTVLVLEASTDSASTAARSVMERFEDAYLHFDRPDYAPDRLGVLPLTIIGITVAVGLLLFLLWRTPAFQKMLPKPPPSAEEKKRLQEEGGQPAQTSCGTLLIARCSAERAFVTLS